MIELVKLKIGDKKIDAIKYTYNHILDGTKLVDTKIKYEIKLDIELYKTINTITKINNKLFYKSDINSINQKEFYLIEC